MHLQISCDLFGNLVKYKRNNSKRKRGCDQPGTFEDSFMNDQFGTGLNSVTGPRKPQPHL